MKKLPINLIWILLAFVSIASAEVTQEERAALEALYNSTDGTNWTDNSNWLVGDPCANEWIGVYCSEEYITGVELLENNLTGQIPAEINQLSELSYLDLSSNNLTGKIPAELFELSTLEILYLNYNLLTGIIPAQIGNLTNLKELSLSKNNFSGNIPKQIGNLTNLSRLSLTQANLTGEIPTEVGQLTQLTGLYLFNNHLSGEIPPSIGNLTQLRSLHLFNNQLTGQIPSEIGNLSLLFAFFISGNNFSGEFPETVINLENLIFLDFRYNALYSSDSEVSNFITDKDCGFNGFEILCPSTDSQTEAPQNFHVASESENSMTLAWDSVSYQQAGGYQLWMSESEEGPYRLIHETENKQETMFEVSSLTAGVDYYFQLKSFTSAHEGNKNLVYSDAVNLAGEKSSSIYYPMNSAHSGSWSNLAQDGHGLAVEVLPNNTAIVYWYVFDNTGNPIWLLGAGDYVDGQVTVDMSISSGGLFPPDFIADDVNRQFWGTMTVEFTANDGLQASWIPKHDSDFQVGNLNMRQFARMYDTPTVNESLESNVVQSSHSGSWFDPAQNGHGLAVQILSNNVGVIYWYAYDNQGNQVWIVGSGTYEGSQLTAEMNTVAGAMFPPDFDSNAATRTYWGTVTLTLDDCNNGQFSWSPEDNNSEYTAGDMPVTRLTALSGLSCED